MMGDTTTPARSRALSFQAGIALFVSAIFAAMHFNLFGVNVNFLFAPFIVLFLWPKGSDLAMSFVAIFLSGLFLDFLMGAPLGGWALIYLPTFLILTLFSRRGDSGVAEGLVGFGLAISGLFVFFLAGKYTNFLNVDIGTLFKAAIVSLLLFPVIYNVKDRLRSVLGVEES